MFGGQANLDSLLVAKPFLQIDLNDESGHYHYNKGRKKSIKKEKIIPASF